jgi:hypothetical protein
MTEVIDFNGVKTNVSETPKFDPNKKYTWAQDTTFTIRGGEFGLLLNTLRSIVNTKEAQTILLAKQAEDVLEDALAAAVEAGVVVEVPENKSSL